MTTNNELAFIFPGQGSQQVGMLSGLAEKWPLVEVVYAQASEVLGYDLWRLIQQGPQEELNMTEKAQPALLTASYAVWRLWQQESAVLPGYMAGHSLGEWSALVCAGVLEFEDAVELVQLRGRYMQQAVPVGEGGMAAIIGLADEEVLDCCRRATQEDLVAAVNFNSPGQLVIAGHVQAVQRAMELCKAAGAKRALPLPVSAPFHTELMQPAAEKLAAHLEGTAFAEPKVPVIHNVHGKPENDPQKIKALMIQQICSPVLWVDCVNALSERGVHTVMECGPGKVLGGLVKRINKDLTALNSDSLSALEQAIQSQS